MAKLAFIGNSEPPSKLLQIWKKQTPGSMGIWGQLQGVDTLDADYYMVVDVLPSGLGVDPKKCVFLGAHPPGMKPYADMSNYTCLAKADCKNTVGFLEWWINLDYDYLKALQPPTKTKLLGAVTSDADTMQHHRLRKDWLRRFCQRDNLDFNLHGRIKPDTPGMIKYYRGACGSWDPRGAAASGGNDHMSGKEQFYLDHKYVLEFDAEGRHYFSERILDSMLLWAMPLYWGGSGMHEVLPPESFRYINVHGDASDVMSIVNSDFYEKHLADLAEARRRLLDEQQLWPKTHKLIFGTYS